MTHPVPALSLCLIAMAGCATEKAASGEQERREQKEAPVCDIPDTGPLSIEQLPEGSSVMKCDAVGRIVVWRDAGVVVPSPGEGMDIFVEPIDAARAPSSFGIIVSKDGIVSYEFHDGG